MFQVPLIVSTCLLALAHGSNEVSVAAVTAAQVFMLDNAKTFIDNT